MLNALRIPVKKLHVVERRVFQDPQFDMALWPRAKRVLEYALYIERNELARVWDIQVCESEPSHKDVLERMEQGLVTGSGKFPLFLTRFKGTTSSFAYSAWSPTDTAVLSPPYSAIADMGTKRIILQETTAFLGRLGLGVVFEEVLHNEET